MKFIFITDSLRSLKQALSFSKPFKENAQNKEKKYNPWLDARKTWNDHVGSIIDQRDFSRLVCLLSLMIALASVAGMIYFSSRSKLIPYVVEVDRLGHTFVVGASSATNASDPRIIRSIVADFIVQSRMVTPDSGVQRKAILRVYTFIDTNGPALAKINGWFNPEDNRTPFDRAAQEMVSVQVNSVLPLSNETWQVDWEETVRTRNGVLTGKPIPMRALVTIAIKKTNQYVEQEEMLENPLGILIHDFSWSRLI